MSSTVFILERNLDESKHSTSCEIHQRIFEKEEQSTTHEHSIM
jgi:hypothetical protein